MNKGYVIKMNIIINEIYMIYITFLYEFIKLLLSKLFYERILI